MSTRAVIAVTLADGTWRGVWNHDSGHTQHLGKLLVRAVAKHKGDLAKVVADAIDGCPQGWSSYERREPADDPVGFLTGTFDGIVATCDAAANPLVMDANYLYLYVPAKRRLYVFEIADKPMRPFGIVTFDDAGKPKPSKLPPVEE